MFGAIFADRIEAGRRLASRLERWRDEAPLVLAVPRGGVVVGFEVARHLGARLDLVIARKIGAPGQPELAIGAVVSGDGIRLIDERSVGYLGVSDEYIEREAREQEREIERRMALYRGDRPPPAIEGQTVIVVDDGIATGYTIRAALFGIRRQRPRRLIAAVPVAPPPAAAELADVADEVVVIATPDPFIAVGCWYERFDQNTDEEVRDLLARASQWHDGLRVEG